MSIPLLYTSLKFKLLISPFLMAHTNVLILQPVLLSSIRKHPLQSDFALLRVGTELALRQTRTSLTKSPCVLFLCKFSQPRLPHSSLHAWKSLGSVWGFRSQLPQHWVKISEQNRSAQAGSKTNQQSFAQFQMNY